MSSTRKAATAIKWEIIEKSSYKRLGGELLKKGNVFNHNLILIPCNEVGNNHWFLLCVYPKVQHVMVLYLIVQLENSLSLHIKDLSLRCGGHWL